MVSPFSGALPLDYMYQELFVIIFVASPYLSPPTCPRSGVFAPIKIQPEGVAAASMMNNLGSIIVDSFHF